MTPLAKLNHANSPLPPAGVRTGRSEAAGNPSASPLRGEGPGERERILDNVKTLRTHQTLAEQRLWYHLRAHRFMDLKFKRQKPVGSYIVDFICMECRLVIELDGGQHAEQTTYDQERDAWLRSEGYTVLRFWNNDVMQNLEGVLEEIRSALTLSPSPSPDALSPTLSRKRERGQTRKSIANPGGRGEQHAKPQDGKPHESPLPLAGEG